MSEHSKQQIERPKPVGRWPYALVAVRTLFLAITFFGAIYEMSKYTQEPVYRVDIAQTHELDLPRHGRHYVFYEYQSEIEGREYTGSPDIETIPLSITRVEDASAVELLEPTLPWDYDMAKYKGKKIKEFWVLKPGLYRVAGTPVPGASQAICISQKLPTKSNPLFIYMLFAVVPALIIYVAIVIVTYNKRKTVPQKETATKT